MKIHTILAVLLLSIDISLLALWSHMTHQSQQPSAKTTPYVITIPTPRKLVLHDVVATAYSPKESASMGGGKLNRLGFDLFKKIDGMKQIAVDPKVIPLGSIVTSPETGPRIATDIGGAIKNKHVDIPCKTLAAMRRWGKQEIDLEIVRFGWNGQTDKTTLQQLVTNL